MTQTRASDDADRQGAPEPGRGFQPDREILRQVVIAMLESPESHSEEEIERRVDMHEQWILQSRPREERPVETRCCSGCHCGCWGRS